MEIPGTELAKILSDRLAPFLDPISSEAGGYLADRIRFLRFKNALRAQEQAEQMIRKSGLENAGVEIKLLMPILEGASLETEDGELVERWAGLLASAATGDGVLPAFPSILRELSAEEARLLDYIGTHAVPAFRLSGEESLGVRIPTLRGVLELGPDEFRVRMLNLERLGLVHQLTRSGMDPNTRYASDDEGHVGLSSLGRAFVSACRGPGVAEERGGK